jgi:hypothetical protein
LVKIWNESSIVGDGHARRSVRSALEPRDAYRDDERQVDDRTSPATSPRPSSPRGDVCDDTLDGSISGSRSFSAFDLEIGSAFLRSGVDTPTKMAREATPRVIAFGA